MNKNILGSYKNGNYYVTLFEDGTKIRFNKENYMRAFARLVENNRAKAKAKGGGYIGYKDAEAVMNWWLRKDQ